MAAESEPAILLLATTNAGKARQYQSILAGLPLRLRTLTDLGIQDDVEETGASFLENARLKAQAYRAAVQARGVAAWVLADDSGLEVDALGGAPGVLSTRWAGPRTTAAQRNTLLLERLQAVPPAERGARFRCVIVLISPQGAEFTGDGTLEGRIAFAPRQHPGWGFGYDPIFELPGRGLTLAEIPPAEAEAISHRGLAAQAIRAVLQNAIASPREDGASAHSAPPSWETGAGFRAVWETAGDAMVLSDPAGIVLAANPAYYQLYGYTPAEVIGQNFALIFPAEVREWAAAQYQQIFAQPEIAPIVESAIRKQDGTPLTVEVRYSFVTQDGRRTAMLSTIRDITHRTRMQAELQAERQRTVAILDSTTEGLFGIDADGNCTFINPAALEFLGRTAAECLGHNMHELTHYKRADGSPYPVEECPIYQAFQSGQPRRLIEEVLWHKDGHPLPALYSCSPIREDGRVVGAAVTIIDVAERRRAEEERARLLEREQAAHAQAAQALQERDEVFSLVTHDLKNPLTAIKGLAQLLKRQIGRAHKEERAVDTERLVQGLEQIDSLSTQMTAQINELLDWARQETHRPRIRHDLPTDLVALARRKTEAIRRTTPKQPIEFSAAVPQLIGDWDPGHLERTLDNLLANAVKYSPAGGPIVVQVAQEAAPTEGGRGWAVLTVQDHGIGIPAADRPHIFDWYRRARNVPPEVDGTGIGLAAVRQIVEEHGGTIAVASEEGAGSTFTVRLPL